MLPAEELTVRSTEAAHRCRAVSRIVTSIARHEIEASDPVLTAVARLAASAALWGARAAESAGLRRDEP
jgi:hypothetical protein